MPLRKAFASHTVSTAYEQGWAAIKNGDLLQLAENLFDVLITTDKNLRYEQNLVGRKLAILVLPFASWPRLKQHTQEIARKVNDLKVGDYDR